MRIPLALEKLPYNSYVGLSVVGFEHPRTLFALAKWLRQAESYTHESETPIETSNGIP